MNKSKQNLPINMFTVRVTSYRPAFPDPMHMFCQTIKELVKVMIFEEKDLFKAANHGFRRLKEFTPSKKRFLSHCPGNRKRMSTSHALGHYLIGPAMLDFCQKYPEIKLEMIFTESLVDLAEEGIDLAIRSLSHIVDSELLGVALPEQSRVIVGSSTYLQNHGTPKTPWQLKDHKVILFQAHKRFDLWYFVPETQIRVPSYMVMNNYQAVIQAVKRGLGIANVFSYQVQNELKSGELVQLVPEFEQPKQSLLALYQQRRIHSAKLEACLSHLRTALS